MVGGMDGDGGDLDYVESGGVVLIVCVCVCARARARVCVVAR